ncbi:hypothetical protein C441_16324 [Haloferax sulfurifontis ATCC BAA-897]|uniref:Uncharacterized protein n=1 Tax=Haloferax sulfurifontis ATCC BAA-897 TaxID=662480 RepID=M0HZB2_9EURY|nr:hypothetical protein C441_16324 [Haloferax sulfurifontis ATCC BAA-897]
MDVAFPPVTDDVSFVPNAFEERLVERLQQTECNRFTISHRVESLVECSFGVEYLLEVATDVDCLLGPTARVIRVHLVDIDICALDFGCFDCLESEQ